MLRNAGDIRAIRAAEETAPAVANPNPGGPGCARRARYLRWSVCAFLCIVPSLPASAGSEEACADLEALVALADKALTKADGGAELGSVDLGRVRVAALKAGKVLGLAGADWADPDISEVLSDLERVYGEHDGARLSPAEATDLMRKQAPVIAASLSANCPGAVIPARLATLQ